MEFDTKHGAWKRKRTDEIHKFEWEERLRRGDPGIHSANTWLDDVSRNSFEWRHDSSRPRSRQGHRSRARLGGAETEKRSRTRMRANTTPLLFAAMIDGDTPRMSGISQPIGDERRKSTCQQRIISPSVSVLCVRVHRRLVYSAARLICNIWIGVKLSAQRKETEIKQFKTVSILV